jgi:hypothetical protein
MELEEQKKDAQQQKLDVDTRTLTLLAGGILIFGLIAAIVFFISSQRQQVRNEESITRSVIATGSSAAPTPSVAPKPDDNSPFGTVQNDAKGYDGYAWDAPLASVAKRRDAVAKTFTQDSGVDGPPGLATIIWMGIGLPPNHHVAQAETFSADAFGADAFATLRRGSTQFVFDRGHLALAFTSIPAYTLERVREKLANDEQELPSLHVEETFDLSSAGSGLPPEAVSSDCYKKANTNTRIYVIEKWSTSVAGRVTNDRAYVVYVPNAAYETLLREANTAR